jgi:hypothetical protein
MQIAFRVKTDAAILGAGFVLAGGADTYPAPPATPRHHPKLTTSFSPKGTKCNLRFASMAQRHGFYGDRTSTGFCSTRERMLFLNPDSCILDTVLLSRAA